jgi:hypothetical protein
MSKQLFSVYVAASSSEMDRARAVFSLVKSDPALSLALDWIAQIERVGVANAGISIDDGARYAEPSVRAVRECGALVFLIPTSGGSRGAWFELGIAVACEKPIVVVGDPVPVSIFASYAAKHGTHVATDEQAIEAVRRLALAAT